MVSTAEADPGLRGVPRIEPVRGGIIDAHRALLASEETTRGAGRPRRMSRRQLEHFAWRLFSVVATLVGVSIIAFVLLDLVPGDPARVAAGEFATEGDVARVRAQLRLDDPIVVRWGSFVAKAVQGDLGTSIQVRPGAPVVTVIADAVPITASMTILSLGFATVVSLPLGFLAAVRKRTILDRAVSLAASIALAIPPYVVGLVLLTIFAIDRSTFPAVGYTPFGESPVEWLRHLVLPALTLATVPLAEMTRQTRGALIDTFDQDFIRAARARGLRRWQVVGKHAMKNSAAPVLTVSGLQFARTIGGSVIVERIFNLPGLGSVTYLAVTKRDLPLIVGLVVVSALAVLLVNFIVDLLNGRLSPRGA